MRKLATVLSLVVLCVTSASAQWNLAQDPAATYTTQTQVSYSVQKAPNGFSVTLKTEGNSISDEIVVWRTGTGTTAYTVADIGTYDASLLEMTKPDAIAVQCKAAVLTGLATGRQIRPASGVARTKVWYSDNGAARSKNFEIRWDAQNAATVTLLPDDVPSGAVN